MAEVLHLTRSKDAFDPEAIKLLTSALEDAWDKIEKSGSQCAKPGYAKAMREVVAKRIFEMARRGEQNPDRLASDAIRFVETDYGER